MNASYDYDREAAEAGRAAGCLLAILFWALLALFRGLHALLRDLFEPVRPGIVVGRRRTGLRKEVSVPFPALTRHVAVDGATGAGKSTLLQNTAVQLMAAGEGLTVISPKADLVEDLLPHVPKGRVDDTILWEASDRARPIRLNVLEAVDPSLCSRVASDLVTIYHRLFQHSWGPRLEYVLRMALMALLSYPGATLACIQPLLVDDAYRRQVLAHVKNPAVLQFWHGEYEVLSPAQRTQVIQPVLNKVQSLMVYPEVYNILSAPRSTIDFAKVMDQGRILLVNLPQGLLGEDVSAFLGGLILAKIETTVMARAGRPQAGRRRHTVIVDEAQNYGGSHASTHSTFTKLLTEARAFNLGVVMATQHSSMLAKEMRDAVEHNVATSLTCQMERGRYTVLYRQPQDAGREELLLTPLPPLGPGDTRLAQRIRQQSRQRYGRPVPRPSRRGQSRPATHRPHAAPAGVSLFRAP